MRNAVRENEIEHALIRAAGITRGRFEPIQIVQYLSFLLFLRYVSDTKNSTDIAKLEPTSRTSFDILQLISLPSGSDFRSLFETRNVEGFNERFNHAIVEIERANKDLSGIFQNIGYRRGLSNTDIQSDEILRNLIECFAEKVFDFTQNPSSDQYLVSYALDFLLAKILSNRSDASADIIPPAGVADLIIDLVKPSAGNRIYDPACGTGSMLMKCMEYLEGAATKGKAELYGQEKNMAYWGIAKLNFMLRRLDSGHLACGDTLREPMILGSEGSLMQFDVVLGNPPFSMHWDPEIAERDKFQRFKLGIPSKSRADYAFILHMLASLKEDTGRMATIVPHGVLFRGGAEKAIRRNLIEANLIDAVIGLPPKLFLGTAISTAILMIRKNKSQTNVLFIDASREFEPNKIQNVLKQSQTDHIAKTYSQRNEELGYAKVVSMEELRGNDYNLNIPSYIHVADESEKIDIEAIRIERLSLKDQLATVEQQIENALSR